MLVTALRAARRAARPAECSVQRRQMAALTPDNLNPNIARLEYAVRGPLVMRAQEIEKELHQGVKKPFHKVIRANIGDAHAMGQQPMTFIRQVLACVCHPPLAQCGHFPPDVSHRAAHILHACGGGSAGSYSSELGVEVIRRHVAQHVACRDHHACDWQHVYLCAGATSGVRSVLQLLCNTVRGQPTGVLAPIPLSPLYSATLAEYGLTLAPYYLDEERGWALDEQRLECALEQAACACAVRALVVINPGNPTGQVLTRAEVEMIIKFARRHNLLLLADEVYQHNVYDPCSEFHSFKKVMMEMGEPYCNEQELASFMSVSKGYMGECGIRGGWMELVNLDPTVRAHHFKTITAMLCPTTLGQAAVDCVANPPCPGEPSYDQWNTERTRVLSSLARRAAFVADALNAVEGVSCSGVQGAMYAFPRVELSPRAVAAADAANQPPDVYYASRLLEETGICVVPGSGFGQQPGTYHFRTTILPQTALLEEMLQVFKAFHIHFTKEHA